MNNFTDELLRYPIGKFSPKESYSREERDAFILSIERLPDSITTLVNSFSKKQWETPYREGGWTAQQVVHHLADSHMNAYVRIKWTLTEESPIIKAYDEKLWAETPEVFADPGLSLNLLKALHTKWVTLLRRIPEDQLERYFIHPETKKQNSISRMMGLYSWHGEHHYGHLKIIAGNN
jgi:hypothetical protein